MLKFLDIFMDRDTYIMRPDPPPPPKAKWRIDVASLSLNSNEYPYKVERYHGRLDYYDTMNFFGTLEEAKEYVEKHYDFPLEYFEKPEVK